MKRSNLTYSILLAALVLAVSIYITLYIIGMFRNTFQAVPAVRYTAEESFGVTGYVVRNEKVITSPYDLVEPVFASGEKVSQSETIARAYSDEEAYRRVQKIDELEERLEQIKKTIDSRSSDVDSTTIETELSGEIIAVLRLSGAEKISELGSASEKLKSLMLRKEYLYGNTADLEQTRTRLEGEISALRAQGSSDYTDIRSEEAGTFSSYVDGYERHLNGSILEGMTLEDFDNLESMEVSAPDGAYGKLISGVTWYFVTAIDSEELKDLGVGSRVSALFSGSFEQEVDMSIVYLAGGTDGRTLVTFSCDQMLYAVTGLRFQMAQITYGAYEGIRIPKKALTISSDGIRGVYCLDGMRATFKAVTIIGQTGEHYIVKETRSDPHALRVGNEVIVTLKGIFEGKVLK